MNRTLSFRTWFEASADLWDAKQNSFSKGDRVQITDVGTKRGIPNDEEGTVVGVNGTEVYVVWDQSTPKSDSNTTGYRVYSQHFSEVKPTGKNVGDGYEYRKELDKKAEEGPTEAPSAREKLYRLSQKGGSFVFTPEG